MRKTTIGLALAILLSACGSAGAGGGAPQKATTPGPAATAAPAVAGTEAPKEYPAGKTANPSSSPDDYMGY